MDAGFLTLSSASLNPNFPNSVTIRSRVLQDFDGFGTAHGWHHGSTRGLMSEFVPNSENVPLSYCTVMDFGRLRTARGRNVNAVGVNEHHIVGAF